MSFFDITSEAPRLAKGGLLLLTGVLALGQTRAQLAPPPPPPMGGGGGGANCARVWPSASTPVKSSNPPFAKRGASLVMSKKLIRLRGGTVSGQQQRRKAIPRPSVVLGFLASLLLSFF